MNQASQIIVELEQELNKGDDSKKFEMQRP